MTNNIYKFPASHEFRFSHYNILEKSLPEFSKASPKNSGISKEIRLR